MVLEKIVGESSKTMESFKRVVSRHTRLNMQVGKGAVQPKKVYRYPSPASQPLPEAPKELHMAIKEERLDQIKYGKYLLHQIQ